MPIKKLLFFVSALFLFQSCIKEDTPAIDDSIPWKLSEYTVSYFDADGQKVFEESPETLKQFDNIIISENTLQLEMKSQSKKAKGLQIKSDNSQTLPVTLVYFKGFIQISGVKITWATANEQNNSHFEILRSLNGESFSVIAMVTGIGNSTNVQHHYSYTDNSPLSGTNYYQLKQVDYNGKATDFAIIAVNYSQDQSYKFTIQDGKTYTPFPVESFENVEIVRTDDNKEMKWQATEANVRYEENGELKIAAYAKLEMRFTR